ncbi:MAG: AMP-binding protein, partial [Stackebrandtia sp.]
TDLFDEQTASEIADRWIRVLHAIATDPGIAVGAVDVLDASERADLLARTGGPAVAARTLPQLLAEAVARDPKAPAVIAGGSTLSYRELDERSNRLARVLIERGIGAEDLVAVAVPRSVDSYLAEWAVAKTGAAFVPIDPSYPADRIDHMVTDSGSPVGVTVASVRADLPESVDWLVLDELETAGYSAMEIDDADRVRALWIDHPAYVIYTSGSTGVPKGVVVTHAGLANFRAEQNERYQLDSDSRALHFASPSFDASILEFLLAIGAGGALVVVPPGTYGGDELGELIARDGVTHALITPSVLATLDPAALAGMRVVIAGGEAVTAEQVAKWSVTPDGTPRHFHNAYGPTEATVATNISDPLTAGDPAKFTEEMSARTPPSGWFARDMIEVEAFARGLARRRPDIAVAILRLPPIVGPCLAGRGVQYFRSPITPTIFGRDPRLQFLHEEDAIEVLAHSAHSAPGGTCNIAGDGALALSQAIRRAGRVELPVPVSVFQTVGRSFMGPVMREFTTEQ